MTEYSFAQKMGAVARMVGWPKIDRTCVFKDAGDGNMSISFPHETIKDITVTYTFPKPIEFQE